MILTDKEIAALDKGSRKVVRIASVKAHTRRILSRSKQCKKDKRIYDFAYEWLSQCDRYGVTAPDRRHMKNLIALLKEAMTS